MNIPLRNIYYILSYAWKYFKPGDLKKIDSKDFRNEVEFFAEIFDLTLTKYIKRGLHRDYIIKCDSIQSIKGKVDFNASMKSLGNGLKRLECVYDEYSADNKINQLLYVTSLTLLKAEINPEQIKSIKKKLVYFNEVSLIRVDKSLVTNIKNVRGNHTLNFLVNISKYIHSNLGFNDSKGNYYMNDFFQKGMGSVFENFVYNFYSIKLPAHQVRNGECIKWDSDQQDGFYPTMKTDITIRDKETLLVIDTKYYQNMFNHHYLNPDKPKFISSNIYQLYTYLNNLQEDGRSIEGMLLYPNTTSTIRNERFISGKKMMIYNLNLNQDWKDIESEMMSIINGSMFRLQGSTS